VVKPWYYEPLEIVDQVVSGPGTLEESYAFIRELWEKDPAERAIGIHRFNGQAYLYNGRRWKRAKSHDAKT